MTLDGRLYLSTLVIGFPLVFVVWFAERFGAWELFFELQVQDAALCYVQRAARLRIGPLGIFVPLAIAPHVTARVACNHPARVDVSVAVTLPCIGLLVAYEGHIDSGGTTG